MQSSLVEKHWFEQIGISASVFYALFGDSATVFVAGSVAKRFHFTHQRGRTLIQYPPEHADLVVQESAAARLGAWPAVFSEVQERLGPHLERAVGPVWLGALRAPKTVSAPARRLDPKTDTLLLEEFLRKCEPGSARNTSMTWDSELYGAFKGSGGLVAVCSLTPLRSHLLNVGVLALPEARRSGAASAAMGQAFVQAPAETTFQYRTLLENRAAVLFAQKNGFVSVMETGLLLCRSVLLPRE